MTSKSTWHCMRQWPASPRDITWDNDQQVHVTLHETMASKYKWHYTRKWPESPRDITWENDQQVHVTLHEKMTSKFTWHYMRQWPASPRDITWENDQQVHVKFEGNKLQWDRCCSSSFPHLGHIACCPAPDRRPPTTKALHTKCDNNTIIVSSSWWWACKCPKHVEQIMSAVKHSVASSCFPSLSSYSFLSLSSLCLSQSLRTRYEGTFRSSCYTRRLYTSVQGKLLYQSNWPMFMSASQLG